jgi:hypothetical protein
MQAPKEWPKCAGCGERQRPTDLVDGLCRSLKYAQPIPKLDCARLAAKKEPLRFAVLLASVRAKRDAVARSWRLRHGGGQAA